VNTETPFEASGQGGYLASEDGKPKTQIQMKGYNHEKDINPNRQDLRGQIRSQHHYGQG
jgi:hypothetical protein